MNNINKTIEINNRDRISFQRIKFSDDNNQYQLIIKNVSSSFVDSVFFDNFNFKFFDFSIWDKNVARNNSLSF